MEGTDIWRDIPGYEGIYQASTEGKVKSLNYKNTGKEGELKASLESSGYLHLVLSKDGVNKTFRVHRIIALTFLEPIPGKNHIDHIDGNRLNNSVSNLRWVSQKENNNFEPYKKCNSESHINNKKLSKTVLQLSLDGTIMAEYESISEAARQRGIYHANISACCRGKLKTAGHYIWKFAS